jgi:ABC-type nitrate/sulfonate/bicarbonate transport system substrate-binding protein
MDRIQLDLLRGICQIPAYVACEKKYFEAEGIDAQVEIAPTAWAVPERLSSENLRFAVIPWTRVAAANVNGEPLVLLCGSGCEEAAIVVRQGVEQRRVRKVALPQRGGIKDLTAMALMENLGWEGVELIRQPSGDGAILALVGQGADAASMVEPYATVMEQLGIGRIVKSTGDIWPGTGCCRTGREGLLSRSPLHGQ